jgi:protein-S-isoprenylcysteine O-methyltransferase Ste14
MPEACMTKPRFLLRRPAACLAALAIAAASCSERPEPPAKGGEESLPSPFRQIPADEVQRLLRELAGPQPEQAREALADSTPDAFPAFARALAEGNPGTVKAVLGMLAEHLHPDADDLVRGLALSGAETWRRAAALETLRGLAPGTGAEFLLPLGALLAPGQPRELVLATLRVLAAQPVPGLANRLTERAGDPDAEVRALALEAVSALALRHEESGLELARSLSRVQPDARRLDLARALARARRPEAAAVVDLLLQSGDPAVRLEAARSVRERGRDSPPPAALVGALADPDPAVAAEAARWFREFGRKEDVPEIAPLLGSKGLEEERKEEVGALLDRIAGTAFGPNEAKWKAWSLAWMSGQIDPFPPAGPLESWAAAPVPPEPGSPGRMPWRNAAAAAGIALLAAAGIAAVSAARRRRGTPAQTGEEEIQASRLGRVGKWIFDHRILVLLPWFVPPLLLFDAARLPSWPWRLALYGILAIGAAVRVWCTGYRTWAYRSSGERHLMTGGPYATVRHPIYVANFLLGIPLFLAVNLPLLAGGFALWFVLTHFAIIAREDEILRARYGDEWVRYAGKIGRVVARLRPYDQPRGEFSWEPVLKGMELPKAAAILALLPVALEFLPRRLSAAAEWLRELLGMI